MLNMYYNENDLNGLTKNQMNCLSKLLNMGVHKSIVDKCINQNIPTCDLEEIETKMQPFSKAAVQIQERYFEKILNDLRIHNNRRFNEASALLDAVLDAEASSLSNQSLDNYIGGLKELETKRTTRYDELKRLYNQQEYDNVQKDTGLSL